jgi:trans-aconitate 2-methyltransferase
VSTTWDPALYLDFDDHRSRPFHDLIARVGAAAPRRVVDLGCGPGHLTGVLAARWPQAAVSALDSSAEMVAAARERGIAAEQADVRDWTPTADADVVVTNAVLQWVPGHLDLLRAGSPRCRRRRGSRCRCRATSAPRRTRWCASWPRAASRCGARRGARAGRVRRGARGLRRDVDVWETTYHQRLTGPDRCCTGSAPPRCARCATPPAAGVRGVPGRAGPRLRAAYPARPDGTTWFPFRRIFAVARHALTAVQPRALGRVLEQPPRWGR